MRAESSAAMLVAAALVWCAFSAPLAAAVSWQEIDNPRMVVVSDRTVAGHWEALFEPNPRLPERHAAFIALHQADRAIALLAGRLLYRGEPWTRRNDANALNQREWRRRNDEVCGAILRELRWHDHDEAALNAVYQRFLAQVENPDLALSALVSLVQLDDRAARETALRLADPEVPGAFPGALLLRTRELATSFLIETWGLSGEESLRALRSALLRSAGSERIHAIRLVPRGELPELLEEACARLVAEHHRQPLADEDQLALILACARLDGVRSQGLATDLADIVLHADRALATAAASALSTGVPWDLVLPVDGLVARARATDDAALRHALLGLIMRLKSAAVSDVGGADSPWAELSEHRQRLTQWEWEGLVK